MSQKPKPQIEGERLRRAEVVEPEALNVGQLNQAVRDLRELLYDARLQKQENYELWQNAQDRLAHVAEHLLLMALFHERTCECGHSEGCEEPIVALAICEMDDGAPDTWLMCRGCIEHLKVGGVMPESTVFYWADGEEPRASSDEEVDESSLLTHDFDFGGASQT
ncbi:MAG TPA: hypothetical protein VK504_27265 [Vicinamibacterales bacterium]|nr:hypothetical protein [Vicinamibacterales bacterium]